MERPTAPDSDKIPNGWNEQAANDYDLYRPRDYSEFHYDTITAADVKFIVNDGLQRVKDYYERVIETDELTWNTVMAPLDDAADQMAHVHGRALILGEVHPDQEVRDVVAELETDFMLEASAVWYRKDLLSKIKAYSKTREAKKLKGEKARCLEATLYMYSQLGFNLPPKKQARLREIDEKLTVYAAEFALNLKNDNTVVMLTQEELAGMPERYINDLERTDDGEYVVTMKYPHVDPIFMQAENRETRRKISEAFHSVGVEGNRQILEESLSLRHEYAKILGYSSWMHYSTDTHMVETPEKLIEFYNELYDPLMERAAPEYAIMQEMLEIDGHEGPLMIYDRDYYVARLQEYKYKIDHGKINEYLPVEACLDGLHELSGELFGIKIKQVDLPVWHEDVMAYSVEDAKTGELKATFYLDLFSRPGKYTHAATIPLQHGRRLADGTYQKPSAVIVANYSRPCFTYEDLITQAHEDGHLWQMLLTKAELMDFSGCSVEHDICEAPSQMMENFIKEPEILRRIMKHYQTGEQLDDESIKALVESQQIYDLFEYLRRMHLGDIDLTLHGDSEQWDIAQVNHNSSSIAMFLQPEGTFLPGKFGHIMGGYEGGYHTYAYSKVKADDHYSVFEQSSSAYREIGMRYRRIFQERGGTISSAENELEFLGREPNHEAFLRRMGIVATKATLQTPEPGS
ncbi:MAG: Zn-dependent oligopeptidase [Candidatus Nomurabacteria bacterium]|nr:MAG: Zn-dependent oligopeptidase [Candidatus Nomurabacteria bacterium]